MIEILLSPFQFDFMINAFIISTLIAVPMALLSCFLILKGWSLMGDAISHAVLPGVVIAYMVGIPLAIGAFLAGMFCAISTGFLKNNSRIKQDTIMGVVFSGMFGLGLVLYAKIHSDIHLDHILFGDILGVSWADIYQTSLIALLVFVFIMCKWRDLFLQAFDIIQSYSVGLNVKFLHYSLLAMISLTIVGALQSVGLILSTAMLIAPGAIAFLITRQFSSMLILALSIAVVGSFFGVYLSFFIDSAPAPTIVLLLAFVFILTFIVTMIKNKRVSQSL